MNTVYDDGGTMAMEMQQDYSSLFFLFATAMSHLTLLLLSFCGGCLFGRHDTENALTSCSDVVLLHLLCFLVASYS